jgi:hypothetical protein
MLDEHAAQLAARTFLFRQSQAQLLFRQQILLHQNLTEPDFLWPCHACSSRFDAHAPDCTGILFQNLLFLEEKLFAGLTGAQSNNVQTNTCGAGAPMAIMETDPLCLPS